MGRRFYKMTGSGNDFVFLDGRSPGAEEYEHPAAIERICARGTGVGADGLVVLEPVDAETVRIRYYNADGSRAELCGNATLCTATLATRLGLVRATGGGHAAAGVRELRIQTDSGELLARGGAAEGTSEFDAPLITTADPVWSGAAPERGERRIGHAIVGNPHLVLLVDDIEHVDVAGRGRLLRHSAALPNGANVNFVGRTRDGRLAVRTYERGVEGETLACGTGSVATALMLHLWGEAGDVVELRTRSGRTLRIRLRQLPVGWTASLAGEGRLVFTGELADDGGSEPGVQRDGPTGS